MRRLLHVSVIASSLVACNHTLSGPSSPSGVQVQGLGTSTGETLFTEDFESDSLGQWQDGLDPTRHRIVTDASAQSGSHYLSVTYPNGRDGGWLTRFFMPGYDTMYVSFYVRFPTSWRGGTKLVGLYGSRTDDQWSAFGKAGICPKGTDFFDAMLITEPTGDPGPLRFYTYYPLMFRDTSDGVSCWGRYNDITNREATYTLNTLSTGTWHRVEFQVQLNNPGQSNGRQVFWIDGAQGAIWPGISFRDTDILKLNAVQLSFSYGASGVPQTMTLDMDNIVVRTAR